MASNKLRNYNASSDEEAGMDMSPMIDMVFLLLLFFLVVSNPKLVKIDPQVTVPVATNAQIAKIKQGRIVINVREDGTFWDESASVEFPDDEAITEYVKEQKELIGSQAIVARLHLRGDKAAVFKYARRVIRASAAAGVNEVIFASYTN